MPRSPVISRAIAAWVVKDVTTRTGAGGSGVPPAVKASSSGKSRSMSVDLVFVGSDGPDRLEGELVVPLAAATFSQRYCARSITHSLSHRVSDGTSCRVITPLAGAST